MGKFGFEQKSFQSKKTNIVFFILLIAVIFVWALLISPDHGGLASVDLSQQLRLDFVNVGQGHAVLIRTPMGQAYLVDGGTNIPYSQARRENRELIQSYLRDLGVRKLDGVVVTHWHNDHLGGINQVLEMYKVDKIWEIPTDFDTEAYRKYEEITARRRVRRITARAGDVLEWGNELFVQVLHPDSGSRGHSFSDQNNMSIVLAIRYGKVQVLLTGDIEQEAQREVVKYGSGLNSQVMQIPHHGANTSDFMPFIEEVSPQVGVIQVGRNNPFNHPSDSILLAYSQLNTNLYRTDRHGNVRLLIGGKTPDDYRFDVDRRL